MENLLTKDLFLSVYVPWVCVPFIQVQIFQNHVSVFVIHRDFCGMVSTTGAILGKESLYVRLYISLFISDTGFIKMQVES